MARPKASEARDTRQLILDAALELFAESGFHATGVREIARAVGIRESAVYHHFPTKDAILLEIFEEMKRGVVGPHTLDSLPEVTKEEVDTMLERGTLLALENFGTLKERKRFLVAVSEGIRLATRGRIELFDRSPLRIVAALLKLGIDTGRLRRADPEFLAMQFLAPLVMWRFLQAIAPGHRFVGDWRAFAKAHVAHFLRAAAADEEDTTRPNERSDRRRRASRKS